MSRGKRPKRTDKQIYFPKFRDRNRPTYPHDTDMMINEAAKRMGLYPIRDIPYKSDTRLKKRD